MGPRALLRPSSLARTPLHQTPHIKRAAPSWTSRRCVSNDSSQEASEPPRGNSTTESSSQQSPFTMPPTQRRPPSYPTQSQLSSADQMSAAHNNNRVFGAEFSNPTNARGSRIPPRLNFDDMSIPEELLDPKLSNKPSEAATLAAQQEETFSNYPRLNPTYGRVVELNPARGRDLVRGIGMLNSLLARNRIRHEFHKQRFHERGGLKRKRLASERWRARFKKGFDQITTRVAELTRKGW